MLKVVKTKIEEWNLENLVCPRDHGELSYKHDHLVCSKGHKYPVIQGVPIMLLEEVQQTIDLARESLRPTSDKHDSLSIETLGVSAQQKKGIAELAASGNCKIDPVVAFLVGATNGIAYEHLVGKLEKYPIPEIRLPESVGETFLDIGCSWGRWCIAAARKGYLPIGLDPSLGAVLAAKRVAQEFGLDCKYVVGDARFLPFKKRSIQTVFSYSVLQHLSQDSVGRVLEEVGRILTTDGHVLVQMPTKAGVRCLYHQMRRGFRSPEGFDVRYWSVPSLRRLFSSKIGPSQISIDCFFGIGLQYSDLNLMSPPVKAAVIMSEGLRHLGRFIPAIKYFADSVYVSSSNNRHAD
jgi:SAM-dependent methyltransferase